MLPKPYFLCHNPYAIIVKKGQKKFFKCCLVIANTTKEKQIKITFSLREEDAEILILTSCFSRLI